MDGEGTSGEVDADISAFIDDGPPLDMMELLVKRGIGDRIHDHPESIGLTEKLVAYRVAALPGPAGGHLVWLKPDTDELLHERPAWALEAVLLVWGGRRTLLKVSISPGYFDLPSSGITGDVLRAISTGDITAHLAQSINRSIFIGPEEAAFIEASQLDTGALDEVARALSKSTVAKPHGGGPRSSFSEEDCIRFARRRIQLGKGAKQIICEELALTSREYDALQRKCTNDEWLASGRQGSAVREAGRRLLALPADTNRLAP